MAIHDEKLKEELVLKIIYTLMPAYTSLFNEYVRIYFFAKHTTPLNYKRFMDLYAELEIEGFRERLEHYFFLE